MFGHTEAVIKSFKYWLIILGMLFAIVGAVVLFSFIYDIMLPTTEFDEHHEIISLLTVLAILLVLRFSPLRDRIWCFFERFYEKEKAKITHYEVTA